MPAHPFALVIFDCDGVLVDSERLANAVFAEILNRELGWSLSLQDMFDTFVGRSAQQCLDIIAQRLGHAPPPDLAARYRTEINNALAESVMPVHGIQAVLAQITLPVCVASGGSHAKMRITLGKTGLWPHFAGRIFSTDDVSRPKPAPDVYLHAAAQMGVAPERCLVIEDSPLGVAAGVAAGMTVFGYAELNHPDKLRTAGAQQIFADMHALPALIDNTTSGQNNETE